MLNDIGDEDVIFEMFENKWFSSILDEIVDLEVKLWIC